MIPYPAQKHGKTVVQSIPFELDEEKLKSIASITDGKYYRVTESSFFKPVLNEIRNLINTTNEVPVSKQSISKDQAERILNVVLQDNNSVENNED